VNSYESTEFPQPGLHEHQTQSLRRFRDSYPEARLASFLQATALSSICTAFWIHTTLTMTTTVGSLAFGGALTSRWYPPNSCLSTTSQVYFRGYSTEFFLGYHTSLGIDPNCFPPMPTTTTSTTSLNPISTSFVASVMTSTSGTIQVAYPTIISTITWRPDAYRSYDSHTKEIAAYFSPGICPSGYEYAASFTGITRIPDYPSNTPSPGESESRYLCCPSGYTVHSTSGYNTPVRVSTPTTHYYKYPLCTREAATFSNVVEVGREWPTTIPPELLPSKVSARSSGWKSNLTAIASGIIVGWRNSDAIVTDFIRNNKISLPK
jgi:hypothetical protein